MPDRPLPEQRPRDLLPVKSLAALVAGMVALIAIALFSLRTLDAREQAADAVNNSNLVAHHLDTFLASLVDAETAQRGYLLTGDDRYLQPYALAEATLVAKLATLRQLTLGDREAHQDLDQIEALMKTKMAELAKTIALRRAGDDAAALAIVHTDEGRQLMVELRDLAASLTTKQQRQLGQRTAAWDESVRWSTVVTFGGTGLLAAILLAIGVLASRDYRAVSSAAWVRRVQVALATELQGDHNVESLADKVMTVLAGSLRAEIGVIYLHEPAGLRRVASHALEPSAAPAAVLKLGEGLAGEAAKQNRMVRLEDVPADYLQVTSTLGRTRPRELVILPASIDDRVQAVIELGFLHRLHKVELEALDRVGEAIGGAIRTARDRARLENLLEETQRQAEELQAQQEELRVTNEELEQQSRALQVSQTQLENQQAELEQINAQLEEQAQSLERQRDELARTGTELQRSNEYKSQFLANMSHELRTPLNSSLILAKLLADNRTGNLNEEQVKFASTIYSAGNDLLTLINDILDLSKIEAGMLDVRAEPVVLRRMVDELSGTFQPVASQRQLALELHVAEDAPESIETDPTRLHQIVKNLVSNALKFTERGGVTLEIAREGDQIAIAVRDTGIGIAPDQLESIFEPFRQADGASTRKFGGTGLGLSISRDLARLLGGTLRVESAPGRGSTFTLVIPARFTGSSARPSALAGPEPTPAIAATPVAPAVPATPATPRVFLPRTTRPQAGTPPFPDDRATVEPSSRTLLVIEDDVAFAQVLFDLAHELEFRVLIATTAEDGLALAREYAPSAIVLDVHLPDRSGLAVLDSLKRDPKTRHVPVHVMSVSDYTRAALEMGAVGYALKPVERDRLIDAIKHLEAKFTQKLRRVLIVEDDPLLRESTAKLLGASDVETITAGTTEEALRHLKSGTFDCMVLDLSLPDRSGTELLEEMARGDQYGFPPVIVYTGRHLTKEQVHELEKFSRSIIIKGARSPERLVDEVTLFLHQVESELPPERQRMLRNARDRETAFEGKRILVVEDDVRNVFALTSVLEPKGASVQIARNGREALDKLRAQPEVDLVLMDIMMPEMDGLEATRRLRDDPVFAKLPIIALTAKAMIDDRQKCLDAGANDYIAKPLDVDKLLSLARVWIRK